MDTGIERRAEQNLVPQLDDAWELFGSMSDADPADAVSGGLLLCELRLPGTKMFRSRPDIQGRFDIDGQPRVIANGHDNRDSAVLSVPIKGLAKGDTIKVTVVDRDLFTRDDLIDAAQTAWPGHFPLLLTGLADTMHGTCRHLDATTVSRRLTPALERARTALTRWEAQLGRGVDLGGADLGYPWDQHRALEAGIDGVAALVGWRQADVASLRSSFVSGRERWASLAEVGAADALRGATAPEGTVALGGVTLGPVSRRCGADAKAVMAAAAPDVEAPACLIEVIVAGAAPGLDPGSAQIDLLYAGGHTDRPAVLAVTADRLLFNPAGGGRFGAPSAGLPTALRLRDGRTAQFLRLP